MLVQDKPDTLRPNAFLQRVKASLFSSHLRRFPSNERTLDIGCGWGFSLMINKDFYCVDADEKCIAHLKAQGAKAYLADVAKPLPFEPAFFDNAFTHDVLEHLEEDEMNALFSDVRRVLKKGGLFMNIVPNKLGYDFGLDPQVGHKRFVTTKEVDKAARSAGFELIENWHTPLPERLLGKYFKHNKLVTVCRAI